MLLRCRLARATGRLARSLGKCRAKCSGQLVRFVSRGRGAQQQQQHSVAARHLRTAHPKEATSLAEEGKRENNKYPLLQQSLSGGGGRENPGAAGRPADRWKRKVGWCATAVLTHHHHFTGRSCPVLTAVNTASTYGIYMG